MDILGTVLVAICCFLAIPVLMLTIEVLAALDVREESDPEPSERRLPVAVLVPAHNEASVIGDTLNSIGPQLRAGDRLLVVADNCDDDTAALAGAAGAIVLERRDPGHWGKGYAIDHGIRYLARHDPPEVVILVDADCRLSTGAIDILATQAQEQNRPVQALYRMQVASGRSGLSEISAFAWLMKNEVRPLGLKRLGFPCQLMGTGMAFPWGVIRQAHLAHGHLVEDMKLGIDLALSGYPPVFCPAATVISTFPSKQRALMSQRTRWEHGHLATILAETPLLLKAAWLHRDCGLLTMALDLAVPPLSILVMCLTTMLGVCLGLVPWGITEPLWITMITCGVFVSAVTIAWYRWGRNTLSPSTLWAIPGYIFRKIPLYVGFLTSRQQTWVKTERDELR